MGIWTRWVSDLYLCWVPLPGQWAVKQRWFFLWFLQFPDWINPISNILPAGFLKCAEIDTKATMITMSLQAAVRLHCLCTHTASMKHPFLCNSWLLFYSSRTCNWSQNGQFNHYSLFLSNYCPRDIRISIFMKRSRFLTGNIWLIFFEILLLAVVLPLGIITTSFWITELETVH